MVEFVIVKSIQSENVPKKKITQAIDKTTQRYIRFTDFFNLLTSNVLAGRNPFIYFKTRIAESSRAHWNCTRRFQITSFLFDWGVNLARWNFIRSQFNQSWCRPIKNHNSENIIFLWFNYNNVFICRRWNEFRELVYLFTN